MTRSDIMATKNKEWYKSRAIWASAVALFIAVLTAYLGETSPAVAIAISAASAFGMYGRAVASGPLKM